MTSQVPGTNAAVEDAPAGSVRETPAVLSFATGRRGFSVSRLRLVGAVLRGVPYWVRMRSQGMGEAPVKVHRWRLHQTTQVGECPLFGTLAINNIGASKTDPPPRSIPAQSPP